MPIVRKTNGWKELIGEDHIKFRNLSMISDLIEILKQEIVENARVIDEGSPEVEVEKQKEKEWSEKRDPREVILDTNIRDLLFNRDKKETPEVIDKVWVCKQYEREDGKIVFGPPIDKTTNKVAIWYDR